MEAAKRLLAAPLPAATATSGGAAAAAAAAAGPAAIAAGQQSDHFVLIAAFELWRAARAKGGAREAAAAARRYFLSTPTLEAMLELRLQFAAMLADTHLVAASLAGPGHGGGGSGAAGGGGKGGKGGGGGAAAAGAWADDAAHPCNRYSRDPLMLKAVLVAGLAPRVAAMAAGAAPGARPAWLDGDGQAVAIHPSSVNHPLAAARFRHPFLVYLERVKTARVFLRDCTVVPPAALLLFGGPLAVLHEAGQVVVGGWLRVGAAAQVAVLVKRLRDAVDGLLAAAIAGGGGGGGGSGGSGSGARPQVLEAIRQLLAESEGAGAAGAAAR